MMLDESNLEDLAGVEMRLDLWLGRIGAGDHEDLVALQMEGKGEGRERA